MKTSSYYKRFKKNSIKTELLSQTLTTELFNVTGFSQANFKFIQNMNIQHLY